MEIQDPVYGSRKIDSEVLVELIESRPVQRLREVHQGGPSPFFVDRADTKRFQHSLGVMLLLRDFDASLNEQIAGLLHDVPHTAFSHVADFVFRNEDHEYHDRFMEEIVMNSEIPEILEKHGINVEYILDESNFPMLERDAPDLCADRIDYFLRDAYKEGILSEEDVQSLLEALKVVDRKFVIEDRETAKNYVLRYIQADEQIWASPRDAAVHELFARILRKAMEIDIIEERDLFRTDREIMDVLRESRNNFIQEKLDLLESDFSVVLDNNDYDFKTSTKARFVDPQIAEEDMRRTSEVSDRVVQAIEKHEKKVKSGYCIKIVD